MPEVRRRKKYGALAPGTTGQKYDAAVAAAAQAGPTSQGFAGHPMLDEFRSGKQAAEDDATYKRLFGQDPDTKKTVSREEMGELNEAWAEQSSENRDPNDVYDILSMREDAAKWEEKGLKPGDEIPAELNKYKPGTLGQKYPGASGGDYTRVRDLNDPGDNFQSPDAEALRRGEKSDILKGIEKEGIDRIKSDRFQAGREGPPIGSPDQEGLDPNRTTEDSPQYQKMQDAIDKRQEKAPPKAMAPVDPIQQSSQAAFQRANDLRPDLIQHDIYRPSEHSTDNVIQHDIFRPSEHSTDNVIQPETNRIAYNDTPLRSGFTEPELSYDDMAMSPLEGMGETSGNWWDDDELRQSLSLA